MEDRAGYIICGAQYKTKMQVSFREQEKSFLAPPVMMFFS